MNLEKSGLLNLKTVAGTNSPADVRQLFLQNLSGCIRLFPLTTSENGFNFPHTHIINPDSKNNLSSLSFTMCFQVLSLDEERFLNKIGVLSESDLECIKELLKDLLDL